MKVTIFPIMIGAFGTVTKGLLKGLEDLEVDGRVETIQTTALLRTARILRRVLETCCHPNSSERPSANAGAKLVTDKMCIPLRNPPLRNPGRKTKTGWEMKLEGQIKKLQVKAKVKIQKDPMEWNDQKKTKADKTDYTTWRNKPKTYWRKNRESKIAGQNHAIQAEQNLPK